MTKQTNKQKQEKEEAIVKVRIDTNNQKRITLPKTSKFKNYVKVTQL